MTPEEKARIMADIREILELHYGSIENISYDDKKFILDAVRDSFYVKSKPARNNPIRHVIWRYDL